MEPYWGGYMTTSFEKEIKFFWHSLRVKNFILREPSENLTYLSYKLKDIEYKKFIGKDMDSVDYSELFLDMIKDLGKNTNLIYKNCIIPRVIVARDPKAKKGYGRIEGDINNETITLPGNEFKEVDFITYCHEMGHIPQMARGGYDYLEYEEVLPLFFEYLACLYLRPENGERLFLELAKQRCKEFSRNHLFYENYIATKKMDRVEEYSYEVYKEIQKLDNFKYIKSLDIALQLIDKYKNDKKRFRKEIDLYVRGDKKIKDIVKDLDIETKTCRTLIKSVR